MPHYFFHSVDGRREFDARGIELADEPAARLQAVSFAGEVLRYDPEVVWASGQWRVEVTDEDNRLLFTVITLAVDAPRPEDLRAARSQL